MMRSRILSTGLGTPKNVLTNLDISKIVDTSDEWIVSRTGIKERRVIDRENGETHTTLALQASEKALKNSGLKASDIDFVICCTVTPETWMPITAARVAGLMGCERAAAVDLNSACSGFILGLATADAYIRSGMYKNILVIGIDVFSPILNWEDRKTCVLFGDGAGAAIVQATPETDDKNAPMILGSFLGAQFDKDEFLGVSGGGTRAPEKRGYITMNGQEVFKSASRAMAMAADVILKQCKMKSEEIDWFIPHQANLRIIDMVAKLAKIPEEKIYINLDRWGNTSAATVAIALAEMEEKKILKKGQHVLLDVFGGGFTYGSMIIRW